MDALPQAPQNQPGPSPSGEASPSPKTEATDIPKEDVPKTEAAAAPNDDPAKAALPSVSPSMPPSNPPPSPVANKPPADSVPVASTTGEYSSTKQFTRAEIQGLISKIKQTDEKPAPLPTAKGLLRLQLVDGQYTINVPISEKMVMGRSDPSNVRPVQADFGAFAGYRMGVSRMHAEIYAAAQESLLKLMDLGSSNGTFLNGDRLEANKLYPLYNGDEIRLGQLAIYIYYEIESPVHAIPVRPRA